MLARTTAPTRAAPAAAPAPDYMNLPAPVRYEELQREVMSEWKGGGEDRGCENTAVDGRGHLPARVSLPLPPRS